MSNYIIKLTFFNGGVIDDYIFNRKNMKITKTIDILSTKNKYKAKYNYNRFLNKETPFSAQFCMVELIKNNDVELCAIKKSNNYKSSLIKMILTQDDDEIDEDRMMMGWNCKYYGSNDYFDYEGHCPCCPHNK